jgi:hypothetical protein
MIAPTPRLAPAMVAQMHGSLTSILQYDFLPISFTPSRLSEHLCGSRRQGHEMDLLRGLEEFQCTVSRQSRTEQKIVDDYSIDQTL